MRSVSDAQALLAAGADKVAVKLGGGRPAGAAQRARRSVRSAVRSQLWTHARSGPGRAVRVRGAASGRAAASWIAGRGCGRGAGEGLLTWDGRGGYDLKSSGGSSASSSDHRLGRCQHAGSYDPGVPSGRSCGAGGVHFHDDEMLRSVPPAPAGHGGADMIIPSIDIMDGRRCS